MSTQIDPVARRKDFRVTQRMAVDQRQTLQWLTSLISFLFSVFEGLIGLRILLKLIDANSSNAFARFIYGITSLFVAPFTGLIANPATGGNVLELTSLIALIVYALIAAVLVRLVWLLFYHPGDQPVAIYEGDQSLPNG
jgi:hypothetical protein